MYEVTKYIADDGMEFEDEEECLEYEQRMALSCIKGQFLMLNDEFKEVENPICNFDEVTYIYVKTDYAAEKLHEVLTKEWNVPWDYDPKTAGVWFKCDERDRWIHLDEERKRVKDIQDHGPAWLQVPNYI